MDSWGTSKGKAGWSSNVLALTQVKWGYSCSSFNSSSAAAPALPCCKWKKSFWGPEYCFFSYVVAVSQLSSVTWAQGCSKGKPQMQKAGSRDIWGFRSILMKKKKKVACVYCLLRYLDFPRWGLYILLYWAPWIAKCWFSFFLTENLFFPHIKKYR